MAQDVSGASQDQTSQETIVFKAEGQDTIALPSNAFIADAAITRDSGDLILQTPDGQTALIEGYFASETPPLLQGPDGSKLSPNLVEAFSHAPAEFAAAGTATDESPVGAVEEISGTATVTRTDGTTENVVIGTPIYQGDIVETAADGAINIVFMDETSMAVSQNARLAVDQYSFDPQTESGTTNFSVLRGLFVFTSGLIGRDDPDDVSIETPVGSIGIRGTIIAGDINPGGESQISVLEGAIVVKNDTGETTLSEQFETVKVMGLNQPMEPLGVISPQDLLGRFDSIGDVLPSLFTIINETVGEQNDTPNSVSETNEDQSSVDTQDVKEQEVAEQEQEQIATQSMDATSAQQEVQSEQIQEIEQALEPTLMDEILQLQIRTGLPEMNTALRTAGMMTSFEISSSVSPSTSPLNFGLESPRIFDTRLADPIFTQSVIRPVVAPVAPLPLNLNDPGSTGVSIITDGTMTNRMGYSISALGDLDNDGFDDLVFSNAVDNQNHTYFVFGISSINADGDFTNLTNKDVRANPTVIPTSNTDQTVISGIGDFDGDGVEDYVIGQQNAKLGTTQDNGTISIMSGATPGIVLGSFSATGALLTNQLGASVAGVGDYNNDGRADVIVGSPGRNSGVGAAYFIKAAGVAAYDLDNNTASSIKIDGTGGSTEAFGNNVTSLGDFNGDGYADFAVSAPNAGASAGRVDYFFGNKSGTVTAQGSWVGAANQGLGNSLFSLGDLNGDGNSDVFIGNALGLNSGQIHFGGGGMRDFSFTDTLTGAGAVGDFNGDGYDDFTVSLSDGSSTRLYVVFGKDLGSIPSVINDAYLQDTNNAFAMRYRQETELEIEKAGDLNGDGYDDFAIGVSDANGAAAGDGGVILVYGRDTGATNTVMGTAGNDTLSDMGQTGKSLRGGAGADVFEIRNTNFLGIDGGGNAAGSYDTIKLMSNNLDFRNINFEKISGIERLEFGSSGQTVTLTLENIFNLLKTSDNGILKIENGSLTGTILNIDSTNIATNANDTQIASALNEMGNGATVSGLRQFDIGGYSLYVEADTQVNLV